MVEVDISCVVQDGSVINVATVGVNTCKEHLEDSIELLIARLQNASSRLTDIIETTEGDMVGMFLVALNGYFLTQEEPLARVIMHIFESAATEYLVYWLNTKANLDVLVFRFQVISVL